MEEVRKWLEDNSGSGYGYGSGSGSGYGYGYGSGYGDGYGDGDGDGDGYGLKSFNSKEVYQIDGVPTIITHIKDNVAKGSILNNDFSLTPCYVVKGNGYFAHGETIKEARESLVAKYFEYVDEDEVIEKFLFEFKKNEKYEGTKFFEWHHYLTGSCLMGRNSFVKNHDLDLSEKYTVDEFISICENDYGSSVIKKLKERWNSI